MCRRVGVTAFGHTVPKKVYQWNVRGGNCLDLVTIGQKHLGP